MPWGPVVCVSEGKYFHLSQHHEDLIQWIDAGKETGHFFLKLEHHLQQEQWHSSLCADLHINQYRQQVQDNKYSTVLYLVEYIHRQLHNQILYYSPPMRYFRKPWDFIRLLKPRTSSLVWLIFFIMREQFKNIIFTSERVTVEQVVFRHHPAHYPRGTFHHRTCLI